MYLLLCVVVWMNTQTVDSLQCYTCDHINNTNNCQTMTTCQPNEDCYTQSYGNGNQLFFQLGCRSHDQCIQAVTQSPATIVGRSVTTRSSSCSQCCAVDGCNTALCAYENQLIHEHGPCEDDPGFDCMKISSALNVCSDVKHAKLICKKYCGLCDIVDGAWSDWRTWSNCDVTCGPGYMTRSRTCTNPAPQHGGEDCDGSSSYRTSCNLRVCPIHGQWASWEAWNSCSVTCGIGLQRRHRTCSNPAPSPYGHYCVGDNIGDRICSRTPCHEPIDCMDVLRERHVTDNGIYNIQLKNNIVTVYCDMTTDQGGWTVFQKRFNGSVDFYRTFKEYEDGFGDVHAEFWMVSNITSSVCNEYVANTDCPINYGYKGLKYINEMTTNYTTELRIDLTAADGTTAYETYQNFSLSPGPDYTLHIGKAAGTAGDVHGLSYNNGHRFSTKDKDVDGSSSACAVNAHGGWWYDVCSNVNLNGDYATPGTESPYTNGPGGVFYYNFKLRESLKTTQIMFRRK